MRRSVTTLQKYIRYGTLTITVIVSIQASVSIVSVSIQASVSIVEGADHKVGICPI